MGLDTSHDAWHGAYGGFAQWRHEIAVALGLIEKDQSLFPKQWYQEDDVRESPLNWEKLNAMTDCMGNWTEQPEDPIWYLLNHSDCDGVIKHEHLLPLADRLQELVPVIDKEEYITDWRRNRTQQFVDGLRAAYEAGEDLDFH